MLLLPRSQGRKLLDKGQPVLGKSIGGHQPPLTKLELTWSPGGGRISNTSIWAGPALRFQDSA
jgi:hypothetical protein